MAEAEPSTKVRAVVCSGCAVAGLGGALQDFFRSKMK